MTSRTLALFLLLLLLGGVTRAQDIRISEFLPTNVTGITDEDGNYEGWIKLWNPSQTEKVSLQGWVLTNGSASWTFPAVDMAPDDIMLIWASGKNRTVPTAPLHTNFVLSGTGGVLQLLRPDSSVAFQYNPYPAIKKDDSYGCDNAEPTMTGTYTTPTPTDVNEYNGSGVAGKVNFSVASSTFTDPFTVTLTQAKPVTGGTIYYTVDNTEPTDASLVYTGPIPVTTTVQIRARVYAPAQLPGQTETNCYLQLDSTTVGFTSSMPIIVLTSFDTPLSDVEPIFDTSSYMWVFETGTDGLAHLTSTPTLVSRVLMHRRGSSTLTNPKYNLAVTTCRDRDDENNNVTLLEMPSEHDWVFTAPLIYDLSYIHNPLVDAMSNAQGYYAPRSREAEVFVAVHGGALDISGAVGDNPNDYFGIYNVLEKIKQDSNRVNIAPMNELQNDPVGITGGYIFKIDSLGYLDDGTPEQGFSSPQVTPICYDYPNEEDITCGQRAPQQAYLQNAVNALDWASNFDNPDYASTTSTNGYRAQIDVNDAIDYHILNNWVMNIDSLVRSTYIYKQQGGKFTFGPVWDYDRSLASTDPRNANPSEWTDLDPGQGTPFFNAAWWREWFADPDFYQQYIDRWQALRQGIFSQANVEALIDQMAAQNSQDAVNRDMARWSDREAQRDWTSPFTGIYYPAGYAAEIQRIKDFLQTRANFFDTQWVAPVTTSVAAGNVAAGTSVSLAGPAGATIYYTLDGSDPRPSGGAAPALTATNVQTYIGTPIVISATQRIEARAYNPNWTALTGSAGGPPLVSYWSGLTNPRYSTDTAAGLGNLAITEINYSPAPPTAAELAVSPVFTSTDFQFIELENIGASTIDLGGVTISNGISFTFTNDVAFSVAPGGFVIIAANPTAFAARYGSIPNVVGPWTGTLTSSGTEEVTLGSSSGATIDDLTYNTSWYPAATSGNHTLVVYDPALTGTAYGLAANWRASSAVNGSPGSAEPNLAPTLYLSGSACAYLNGMTLTGTAYDDGLPYGTLTYQWSQLSGPGTTVFASPGSVSTGVTFDQAGTYSLALNVSDGQLSASGTIAVTVNVNPPALLPVRTPVALALDGTSTIPGYLLYGSDMYVYAAVRGTVLYVATWSPGSEGGANDHFIFVSNQLLTSATAAAPWAKAGTVAVPASAPFLAGESNSEYVGWTNAPGTAQAAKSDATSGQMQGTIDLVAAFGAMPTTIYVAAAAYGTGDGGTLVSQGPAGNGDGNLDPSEFLALPVANISDSTGDGTYDVLDPNLAFSAQIFWDQAPGITWPIVAGKTYVVQYRDHMTDAWQTLPGTQQTAPGGQATLSAPDNSVSLPSQRFYRIQLVNP